MPNHVQAAAEGLPNFQRFNPEDMPARYAMLVDGDCLDPVYKRGDALQFDRDERIRPDDYVILFWRHDAVAEGQHQVTVKKLVVSTVNQSFWKPGWVNDSGLKPVVIVETHNPPARFAIDPKRLLGMHKCTGLNGQRQPAPELRAAASAGMPDVTRRGALAMTASFATALSGTALAAPTAPLGKLTDLIAARETSRDRFMKAIDAEERISTSYFAANRKELLAPLSIGGAQSLYITDDLDGSAERTIDDIRKRYAAVILLNGLGRVAPELAEQARLALRRSQASDIRNVRRMVREERRRQAEFGYAQAVAKLDAAADADIEALLAVCSYRCATNEELVTKARFVLDHAKDLSGNDEAMQAFLKALLPNGGAA